MWGNDLQHDKGELEIVYDVQWKTPGNDDDKAKIIGIVDTADTNLDWNTFKSYLIQNSGNLRFTTGDIRISYLDSDDDLIPVDSELEFRECLKFSRTRARRGRKIVMKVGMMPSAGARAKEQAKNGDEAGAKHAKPKLFCVKKKDIPSLKKSFFSKPEAAPPPEKRDPMPEWFATYMSKFKEELTQDITVAVVANIRSALGNVPPPAAPATGARSRSTDMPGTAAAPHKGHHHHHHLHHVLEKRKKKKKMPEEDSSDCTDGLQLQWEERLELLRHMQKINKREKKFEKKLDAKLEKLECKTKKIMEKKHCLWNTKKGGTVLHIQRPPSAPAAVAVTPCQLVMDATPVEEYSYVPHVLRGEVIVQVWTVMNNGQLPWTDETELRFAWGSKSLLPLTTAAKVPLLKPGETGKVKVTLQAPLFPGNFESYWHFHHQGHRFGHWLGCSVVVEKDPMPPQPALTNAYPAETGIPVDLTMKCSQPLATGATDDIKVHIESQPDAGSTGAEPMVKSAPDATVKSEDTAGQLLNTSKVTVKLALKHNSIHSSNSSLSKMNSSSNSNLLGSLNLNTSNSNNLGTSMTNSSGSNNLGTSMINSSQLDSSHMSNNLLTASKLTSAGSNNLAGSSKLHSTGSSSLSKQHSSSAGNVAACQMLFDTETELEEFPTLESYRLLTTDAPKSSADRDQYPDLLQRTKLIILNDGEPQIRSAETEEQLELAICNAVKELTVDDEEVASVMRAVRDLEDRGAEYVSGSDTDNISIISTVSLDTDDTEPSDEFVVVPMPTCATCEQPIDTQPTDSLPVTQPISVEIPKTPSDSDISAVVQPSDSNNNTEMKPYPGAAAAAAAAAAMIPGGVRYPALVTGGSDSSASSGGMAADSTAQDLSELQDEETPIVKSEDETTVYVRDANGVSRPVAKVFISKRRPLEPLSPRSAFGGVGVRHSTFGDPNFGHGPNGPRFPFGFNADANGGSPPPHCHNPGGACNFRPQHESPPCAVVYTQCMGPAGNIQMSRVASGNSETFCSHFCQADAQQQQQQQQSTQTHVQDAGLLPNLFPFVPQAQPPMQPAPQVPLAPAQPLGQFAQASAPCIVMPPLFHQDVGSSTGIRDTNAQAHQKIHTEQPRPVSFRGAWKSSAAQKKHWNKPNSSASSSGSRRSSGDSHETSPVAAAVQILPETLVTGAVNVASSAINTARSVIDMLRPRHDEPVVAQWEHVPPAVENSLHMLKEMGFNNRELNVMLLAQHNNDVARVISELVQ